jgi:hypothetical protein
LVQNLQQRRCLIMVAFNKLTESRDMPRLFATLSEVCHSVRKNTKKHGRTPIRMLRYKFRFYKERKIIHALCYIVFVYF